jgi:hypothetical protein
MIERAVPKDILKHESKMFAGMTSRQLICIGIAVGIAGLLWFSFTQSLPVGKLRIIIVAVPSFIPILFGFVKIQNQPLEKIGMDMLRDNFLTPVTRRKEIHYPEMEKSKRKPVVIEADGTERKLKCDKDGKIIVTRSNSLKTIR